MSNPEIVDLINDIEELLEQMDFRIRDIGKAGVFSPEEERKALENYASARGRQKIEIRNDIIKKNTKLVAHIASRWHRRAHQKTGFEVETLFQQGILGLIKAIEQFSIGRDVKFSTFATPKIEGAIRDFLKKPFKASRYEEPEDTEAKGGEEVVNKIDRFLAQRSQSPEDKLLGRVSIQMLLKKLDPKEAEVIKLRYLSGVEMSLAQVGRRMNLSRERVNQYEKRALKKMKGFVK